ncbi:polyhydroxyalkanoate synthase [Rhodobacter aestuarii]|uniref:Polyhydroxyalkanoate synthase n=1 Tax=Rhodobacter aestuarii TaxID=453582 RepID=A0A1N7M3U3_9RHOB|nr:alpha/beta fold hydrolase [Rhodobacter aestuarii]PTV94829.1 polyhydroxyalkanoate synthase [Rhodobacter aestuarii]SIS80785.1 polyhydroxyalkanoate synthase [Rhodobacter aestuarii]
MTAPAKIRPEAEPALDEAGFRRFDRMVHALMGKAEGGLSPVSLWLAWADWASHMAMSPGKQAEVGFNAMARAQKLAAEVQCQLKGGRLDGEACVEPIKSDRRFASPDWLTFPYSLYAQGFLATQAWWQETATGLSGVEKKHEQLVEFYGRQMLDMLSPSNFLATNPALIARTQEEGGQNLVRGWKHMAEDMRHALFHDEEAPAFTPGENVAVTDGKVVFRNRLIELIQYTPVTDKVHPVPLMIVPAWIMKYYILDLTPPESLIGWLVEQGFTVFCISWKNPEENDRDLGFDDYRELGVMAALDAIGKITGAPKVHGLGYCLGGTLLSVAAAAMARDGDDRLASLTMLAAQVDFTEAGELSLFTNEDQLALLEDMMWQEGFLDKSAMAGTFSMLKSKDLVWSKMVHDYMLGERDAASALGAWSQDATRMPYKMHSEYLRHLFLNNDLADGRMEAGGAHVMLRDVRCPVFAVATENDHIAPWHSVFKLTWLMGGEVSFALVSGGHNTGIVAPPGSPRAKYRLLTHVHGQPHPGPEDWAGAVEKVAGSWWGAWGEWLRAKGGGEEITPPALGKSLGAAPGRYVLGR